MSHFFFRFVVALYLYFVYFLQLCNIFHSIHFTKQIHKLWQIALIISAIFFYMSLLLLFFSADIAWILLNRNFLCAHLQTKQNMPITYGWCLFCARFFCSFLKLSIASLSFSTFWISLDVLYVCCLPIYESVYLHCVDLTFTVLYLTFMCHLHTFDELMTLCFKLFFLFGIIHRCLVCVSIA